MESNGVVGAVDLICRQCKTALGIAAEQVQLVIDVTTNSQKVEHNFPIFQLKQLQGNDSKNALLYIMLANISQTSYSEHYTRQGK